jgi:K+-sensing histidine kinase KdpD
MLLAVAAIRALIGPIVFVTTGWAELLRPAYGLIVSATYLPPIMLLLVSYQFAETAQRLRLRWMLASSALFVAAIVLNNTPLLGSSISPAISFSLSAIAGVGFLYTILRHRVVDFTVILNRTLVYAVTTSLLLGLFALFESLIERSALGHDASLMMELAVPLGLGVSLSTVHRRIDSLIDRLVFRRQYREEVALRQFARECAFVTQPESLLDLAIDQIALHAGVPWLAMYEYTPDGYSRVRQRGTQDLPPQVAADDLALVKLRAHDPEVNLHEAPSAIGRDGYAFPLRVRGHLLGVLVVGPRPGEHSVAEERELLAHVAHEVGAALFALRAEASEARAQASDVQLRELRAREKTLLEALRTVGATTTS